MEFTVPVKGPFQTPVPSVLPFLCLTVYKDCEGVRGASEKESLTPDTSFLPVHMCFGYLPGPPVHRWQDCALSIMPAPFHSSDNGLHISREVAEKYPEIQNLH